MITVKITNNNLLADLEASHYEYTSYMDILNSAKINGYTQEYWSLWEQFMEVQSEYETFKEHLRVEFVVPAVGDNYNGIWEVDFDQGVVFIISN